MKYSKILAALAFSAIISAESVALEPVRHTVFSTDMVTGMYNLDNTIPVVVKVAIFDGATSVYEETHSVTVNKFGFLQFEIGSGTLVSGSYGVDLTPSLIVKTYVVDGENSRIIDSKRMSEIIYNANVSRYSHTIGLNPDPALTGANVIDQIKVDENGVLTTTYRPLTPENIGAADTTQLTNGLALKVDKETGKSLMTDAERTKLDGIAAGAQVNVKSDWNATEGDAQILNKPTDATETVGGLMSAADKAKLNGIEENATNYQHPATHPATMIVEDETHRFVSDADTTKWNLVNGKLDNSLDRGYIFIGNEQNKPEATLGATGEVLTSNGVYNGFAKIKDVNIADNAGISGKKITPDFGPNSEIVGGKLNVGEINALNVAPYAGTIYAEGLITADGGFEGELTTTGNVVAGDINIVQDPGISGGSLTAEGTITGAELISEGNITTTTGNIEGVDIIANGDISAESATISGTILSSDIQVAVERDDQGDIIPGRAGKIYAEGTITADGGFIGNAESATKLTPGGANNVYLGATAPDDNTWGKITNAHIDAAAGIEQSKVANLTTDLAAKGSQAELDATQGGAGLGTDGGYTSNNLTNYLKTATSLKLADEALDTQVKINADAIATKLANKLPLNNVWIGQGDAPADPAAVAGLIANANVASDAAISGIKINPNFGDQNVATTGTVTATTFQGALNGNANTATSASSASLLASTEAAGNSAVAAINLADAGVAKILGGKINPDFTGENIVGDALVIPVDGDIFVGSALDAFTVEGATGNVTAKGTVTAPTFDGDVTGDLTGKINKVTVTAPATGATLTLAEGSTLATEGAFTTKLIAGAETILTLPTVDGTLATTSQLSLQGVYDLGASKKITIPLGGDAVEIVGDPNVAPGANVDPALSLSGVGRYENGLLSVSTTEPDAYAAKFTGSVGITVQDLDIIDPALTISSKDSYGITSSIQGDGVAGGFYNNNVNSKSPVLYINNNSDGNGTSGSFGEGYGASIFVENESQASTSTALYVKSGRTVLSFTEDVTDAVILDLSGLGFASVISIPLAVDGAAVTDITFPAAANSNDGQILYVVNNSGEDMDNASLDASLHIDANTVATFIYANGWKRVK